MYICLTMLSCTVSFLSWLFDCCGRCVRREKRLILWLIFIYLFWGSVASCVSVSVFMSSRSRQTPSERWLSFDMWKSVSNTTSLSFNLSVCRCVVRSKASGPGHIVILKVAWKVERVKLCDRYRTHAESPGLPQDFSNEYFTYSILLYE